MVKLRHYDNLNTARFITFSCYQRFRLFRDQELFRIFLDDLDRWRTRNHIKLLGYVVMPEHVHLVLHPPDGLQLGRAIGELKSRSARRMLLRMRQRGYLVDRLVNTSGADDRLAFWQPRCYDHNCRTPETVREKIEYCHKNPVNRGLARHPSEWIWSSFNWYNGNRDVPVEMDGIEL
ncbi:MAG: transposase [bacterium]